MYICMYIYIYTYMEPRTRKTRAAHPLDPTRAQVVAAIGTAGAQSLLEKLQTWPLTQPGIPSGCACVLVQANPFGVQMQQEKSNTT